MIAMCSVNYLIFHPARAKLSVMARAVTVGGVQTYSNNVFVDPPFTCTPKYPGGNEDPYVFTEPWLYSFCHATQLRRLSKTQPNVGTNSVLIFAEDCKREGTLYVDTVFVVDQRLAWPMPGLTPPTLLTTSSIPVQEHPHLRGGLNKVHGSGHTGRITYTARQFGAVFEVIGSYSFLPITESFERVPVELESLPEHLSQKIRAHWMGRFPVLLDSNDLALLMAKIDKLAAFKVISPIRKGEHEVASKMSACKGASVRNGKRVLS